MADSYWRYGDGRQQPMVPIPPSASAPTAAMPVMGKRPRTDFDLSGDLSAYLSREDERGTVPGHSLRDTDSIGASYDRYLRSGQIPSYGATEAARPVTGAINPRPVDDLRMVGMGGMAGLVGMDPRVAANDRSLGFGGGRPEMSLPPDASSTLFVEGLPANCTRREVAHIFRPFVGYKEVRLVSKESRNPSGDPLILCFVDFVSPAHAATAMDALQGYKFDEQDRDSNNLRLQFARYPGARSTGGGRGKR